MSSDVFRLRDPKPKQDNRELINPREKLYYIFFFTFLHFNVDKSAHTFWWIFFEKNPKEYF